MPRVRSTKLTNRSRANRAACQPQYRCASQMEIPARLATRTLAGGADGKFPLFALKGRQGFVRQDCTAWGGPRLPGCTWRRRGPPAVLSSPCWPATAIRFPATRLGAFPFSPRLC